MPSLKPWAVIRVVGQVGRQFIDKLARILVFSDRWNSGYLQRDPAGSGASSLSCEDLKISQIFNLILSQIRNTVFVLTHDSLAIFMITRTVHFLFALL